MTLLATLSLGVLVRKGWPRVAITAVCLLSLTSIPSITAAAQPNAKASGASTVKKSPAPKKAAAKKPAARPSSAARARQARLAKARAAAARAAWLEAQTPRYKLDVTGALVPDVRAAAAIIYDPETGEVLWEENSQLKRSIASITKVMTASVVLEDDPDLARQVTIQPSDVYRANHTYLRARERVSIGDLLHLTLVASDNAAARALSRSYPDGAVAFVDRMNEKAEELGLDSTAYADPSGLDPGNVSSAYDMARLIAFAASDERLSEMMRKQTHTVRTSRRAIPIRSTNLLVREGDVDVRGGKTGFIRAAGYCLATMLRLPQTGQQVAVVVLGAPSSANRFMETRHLFNWLSTRGPNFFTADAEPAAQPN
jgi:serine-type D-Ala-D-Ala endopeptidase (penicillin-binding protein 7)